MNTIRPETIADIMQAFDEGVSLDVLIQRFPEHRATIEEIAETRGILVRVARDLPEPVTETQGSRLSKVREPVESPYVINSLFFSMNYKVIVPVLVLGVIAVGGTVFFTGNDGQIAQTTENAPVAQTESTREDSTEGDTIAPATTPTAPSATPSRVTATANVNDILAGFSTDIANEQVAFADDGVSADMFAQSELSGFESDDYDY